MAVKAALVSLDGLPKAELPQNEDVVFGRNSFGINNKQVSKHAFTLRASGGHITFTKLGMNKSTFTRSDDPDRDTDIEPNKPFDLYDGDIVYLLPNKTHGYRVEITGAPRPAAPAPRPTTTPTKSTPATAAVSMVSPSQENAMAEQAAANARRRARLLAMQEQGKLSGSQVADPIATLSMLGIIKPTPELTAPRTESTASAKLPIHNDSLVSSGGDSFIAAPNKSKPTQEDKDEDSEAEAAPPAKKAAAKKPAASAAAAPVATTATTDGDLWDDEPAPPLKKTKATKKAAAKKPAARKPTATAGKKKKAATPRESESEREKSDDLAPLEPLPPRAARKRKIAVIEDDESKSDGEGIDNDGDDGDFKPDAAADDDAAEEALDDAEDDGSGDEDDEDEEEERPKKKKKAAAAKKSKPAAKRARKDPNKPKKALSGFLFFSNEQRPILMGLNPGISIKDVAVELGYRWKQMTADDKAKYNEMHEEDKKRYEREMEAYIPGSTEAAAEKKRAKAAPKAPRKKAATSRDAFLDFARSRKAAAVDSDAEGEAAPAEEAAAAEE